MPRLNYRTMETCIRGHDLTVPGALEPNGVAPTVRCVQCRRDRDARYSARRRQLQAEKGPQPPRSHCANGHEMKGDNVGTYTMRSGETRRFCVACKKKANVKQIRLARPRPQISDADVTRMLLWLDREQEHAPQWQKKEIAERVRQLRAVQHRGHQIASGGRP